MSIADLPEDRIHPLLRASDNLTLGFRLDPRDIFDQYLRPEMLANHRTRKSIKDVERAVRRFDEWWEFELSESGGDYEVAKPVVALLRAEHLRRFRGWMQDERDFTNSNCNTHVQKIGAVLRCAVRNEILTHSPNIPSLPVKKAAPKYTLTFEQVGRLWEAAAYLDWPVKRQSKRRLHYSPAMAWRCCLILWVTYGYRTQEVARYDSEKRPLTWEGVKLQAETPNPEGHAMNEWGWIEFTPPKQEWCKPDPVYVPLTMYARAALEHLRPRDWHPEQPVCDWTLSSSSYYRTWHKWMDIAGVKPKKAGDKIQIKHCRKTASTWLFEHDPAISEHVVGHAADRSGTQQVAVSGVHKTHYVNAEGAVTKSMATMEYPACFDEILSCKVAA